MMFQRDKHRGSIPVSQKGYTARLGPRSCQQEAEGMENSRRTISQRVVQICIGPACSSPLIQLLLEELRKEHVEDLKGTVLGFVRIPQAKKDGGNELYIHHSLMSKLPKSTE